MFCTRLTAVFEHNGGVGVMAIRLSFIVFALLFAFVAFIEWQRRAAFRPEILDWKVYTR